VGTRVWKSEAAVATLVGLPLDMVERNLILATLRRVGGNRTMAAQMLGISIRTMRNRIRDYRTAGYPVPSAGPHEEQDP
jgi:DNA-binding NtrC family response regulator